MEELLQTSSQNSLDNTMNRKDIIVYIGVLRRNFKEIQITQKENDSQQNSTNDVLGPFLRLQILARTSGCIIFVLVTTHFPNQCNDKPYIINSPTTKRKIKKKKYMNESKVQIKQRFIGLYIEAPLHIPEEYTIKEKIKRCLCLYRRLTTEICVNIINGIRVSWMSEQKIKQIDLSGYFFFSCFGVVLGARQRYGRVNDDNKPSEKADCELLRKISVYSQRLYIDTTCVKCIDVVCR